MMVESDFYTTPAGRQHFAEINIDWHTALRCVICPVCQNMP